MSTPKQRIPRRPRSVVWAYFDKTAGDPFKATCRLCGMTCQHGSNTSNMFCHLRSKHPVSYEEAEQQREQDGQLYMQLKAKAGKLLNVKATRTRGRGRGRGGGRGRGRPPNTSFSVRDKTGILKASVHVKPDPDDQMNSTFSPQALSTSNSTNFGSSLGRGKSVGLDLNSAILHWLATDMLHPSTVLKKGFRRFLSTCGIHLDLPLKKTISDTLFPKLVEDTQSKIKKELKAASSVAISMEKWTYKDTQTFLTMTAHFINDTWAMASYVLETFDLTEEERESNLASKLKQVTDDWGLTKNVVVVLSNMADEALSNAVVVNGWEEISCFGKALNSIVNDAVTSVPELVRVQEKVSKASAYFYESVKTSQALTSVQQQHGLPTSCLKQEWPNLWPSTYAMMERVLEQYEAINTVLCILGKDHMCLCDDEVELINDAVHILKPFQAAVEELCTEPYTCVSKLIPVATLLQQVTTASMSAEDLGPQADLKNALISQMQQHFSSLESHPLLAAATLLDPRFKQHAFTDAEVLEAAQERLLLDTQAVVKTDPTDDGSQMASDSGASAGAAPAPASAISLWGMFDKKVVSAKALRTDESEADNETHRFFKEVNIVRTADPLQWWRLNEVQFPHLRVLAKKFLCVPATALPSSRLFTKEKVEFSRRREMFRPTRLNNMLFLNQNHV